MSGDDIMQKLRGQKRQGRGKQELFALRARTCEVCTGSMGMGYLHVEHRQEIRKLGHWRERERWEKMLQKSYVQAPCYGGFCVV